MPDSLVFRPNSRSDDQHHIGEAVSGVGVRSRPSDGMCDAAEETSCGFGFCHVHSAKHRCCHGSVLWSILVLQCSSELIVII
jgi:hypothetical protein